jgi:hypothetical protein
MESLRAGVIGVSVLAALALFGCEQGPAQKAGEKIDRLTDQDKIIGKGPLEKAGRNIDKAVEDVKR